MARGGKAYGYRSPDPTDESSAEAVLRSIADQNAPPGKDGIFEHIKTD